MSQAKVDKYKQDKANRKKIMKKEKRQRVLRILLASIVGIAIAGFLVWSVVDKYNEKNKETQQITLSSEEMSSLMEQLTATTTAGEGATTEAANKETSSEKASDEKASDEETSSEKASDEETSSEKASDEETTEAAE